MHSKKHKITREAVKYNLKAIIFYFVLYGVIGWIIDTGYGSFVEAEWQPGGMFKSFLWPIPFAPIYGNSALILIFFKNLLEKKHQALLIFLCPIVANIVEYCGGTMMLAFFHRRAWDYRASLLNMQGHIDLWHSFLWLILGIAFIKIIHPRGKELFVKIFPPPITKN